MRDLCWKPAERRDAEKDAFPLGNFSDSLMAQKTLVNVIIVVRVSSREKKWDRGNDWEKEQRLRERSDSHELPRFAFPRNSSFEPRRRGKKLKYEKLLTLFFPHPFFFPPVNTLQQATVHLCLSFFTCYFLSFSLCLVLSFVFGKLRRALRCWYLWEHEGTETRGKPATAREITATEQHGKACSPG